MDNASSEPTVMPLDLLQEITNGFSEERKLGSGSFGKVYLGVSRDGEKIAVKKLYDMPGLDEEHFQNEFKNLTRLRHKNIVRLVGYCHDVQEVQVEYKGKLVIAEKTNRALCLEYMPNGSLDKYLSDECDKYDWCTGYGIIKGMCEGLKYLHKELKPPIYHLDLKPGNVLLDKNMGPRIADFGISRLFGDEQTRATKSSLGTLGYLPPEYIRRHLISNKFDIFSLGVVIIKIMAGHTGYFNSAEMSSQKFINLVHQNWMNRLDETLSATEAYSEQIKICIKMGLSCVQEDRHKRPTIQHIVDTLNKTETNCTFFASRYGPSLMYQSLLKPNFCAIEVKKDTGDGMDIQVQLGSADLSKDKDETMGLGEVVKEMQVDPKGKASMQQHQGHHGAHGLHLQSHHGFPFPADWLTLGGSKSGVSKSANPQPPFPSSSAGSCFPQSQAVSSTDNTSNIGQVQQEQPGLGFHQQLHQHINIRQLGQAMFDLDYDH